MMVDDGVLEKDAIPSRICCASGELGERPRITTHSSIQKFKAAPTLARNLRNHHLLRPSSC